MNGKCLTLTKSSFFGKSQMQTSKDELGIERVLKKPLEMSLE